jgi:hypothetical protein
MALNTMQSYEVAPLKKDVVEIKAILMTTMEADWDPVIFTV